MITLMIGLIVLCLIAMAVIIVTGLIAVAWPLLIIFGVGLAVDILVLRALIHKK